MSVSVRGTVLCLTILLANNLLWLYLLENGDGSYQQNKITCDTVSENDFKAIPVEAKERKIVAEDTSMATSNIQELKSSGKRPGEICACNQETTVVDQEPPPAYAAAYMDVPIEHSQGFLYQQAINRASYFSHINLDKKLDIIQSLSAQGEDLSLIRDILENENDSTLRIAALSRLNHQHSFIATSTLIETLDDPVAEVALTALNTIVTNGDRTLLPLLDEKMNMLPDGVVRDEHKRLINRLRYSVTMGMDGITFE